MSLATGGDGDSETEMEQLCSVLEASHVPKGDDKETVVSSVQHLGKRTGVLSCIEDFAEAEWQGLPS